MKLSGSGKINSAKGNFKNRDPYYFIFWGLTFFISMLGYLVTLAPTVTFEDSGELITAAYRLGVAHEPGYPLFTMLGKLFTLLPLGNIAYRMNFMSALLSALTAAIIFATVIHLIENTFNRYKKHHSNKNRIILKYAAGVAAGLFYSFGFEVWEQSVITEVYSLHSLLTALFLFFFLKWEPSAKPPLTTKYFIILGFILGLSLTNHSTAVLLIPVLVIYLLLTERKFFLQYKTLLKGAVAALIGLLPLLYLPLASAADPVLDWGNPENLTNFFRTISRHQYTEIEQTSEKFFSGLWYYFTGLLPGQWFPVALILLVPAFYTLYKFNRRFFIFSLLFLVFYIPITTYLTDFEVTGDDFKANLYRLLVSVFYIPSYLFISILFGLGLYYVGNLIKSPKAIYIAIFAVVLLPLALSVSNFKKVNMHNFRYTEVYLENLFGMLSENALVFTQIDYFYFPAMYYQEVEGRRTDVTVLDQPLLRRSWYLDMLKNHEPGLIKTSSAEVEAFLKAVKPFEDGEAYNGSFIEENYIAMINAFIDRAYQSGKDVYFTYIPQKEILRDYYPEPLIGAYLLRRDYALSDVNRGNFDLEPFMELTDGAQLLVNYFSGFYQEQIFSRAILKDRLGQIDEAHDLYKTSLLFNIEDDRIRNFILNRIDEIENPK